MTNDTEYNGWHNYETWAVKLWIDNEEGQYNRWRGITAATWVQAVATTYGTKSQDARLRLADNLKGWHENAAPSLPNVYGDLLSAALGEVDWFEIADSMLTDADLDGYEAR